MDDLAHAARVERYQLKAVVDRLYPFSLTARCGQPLASSVKLWRSIEHGSAFLTGVIACGWVWGCPLCASKISERRRFDLEAGVDLWREQGGAVWLLTVTIPHGHGDDLRHLLSAMRSAWRMMTQSRRYGDLRRRLRLRGVVRSIEVTYGLHGWHPHIHALLFLHDFGRVSMWDAQAAIYDLWADACLRARLPLPSPQYGVRLDLGDAGAASYLCGSGGRWGLAGEMTKSYLKRAKGKNSLSPWDLLRLILSTSSPEAKALFLKYAAAFHNCRQLHYSKGLKDSLGIGKTTDQEVLFSRADSAYYLGEVSASVIKDFYAQHLMPEFLRLAEDNPQQLHHLLYTEDTHAL